MPDAEFGMAFDGRKFALFFDPIVGTQRKGDEPGMTFESTFVALFDGECQRIVAGQYPIFAGEGGRDHFVRGAIDDIASLSYLQKNGVEVGFLQAVQYMAKFFLLGPFTGFRRSRMSWPVQSIDGSQPNRTYLLFRIFRFIGTPQMQADPQE